MSQSKHGSVHISLSIEGCSELIALDLSGTMAMSQLYDFQVEFLSKTWIDDTSLFHKKVHLTWQSGDLTRTIHGIIDQWQVLDDSLGLDQYFHYRFHLVPCVTRLQNTIRLATYLNESLSEIIQGLLQQHQMDFRLDLHQNYQKVPFVCQYQESDWHFICRWLERLGMFFYFEHQHQKETLVITDANSTLQKDTSIQQLVYQRESQLPAQKGDVSLWQFACQKKRTPQKVQVVAYDPTKASQKISAEAMVDEQGYGVVKVWQENLLSAPEVKAYAQTLATVYQWQAKVFQGSIGHGLVPGVYVAIDNTYQKSWNKKNYLIVASHCLASQRQAILANLFHVEQQNNEPIETISECRFDAIDLSQNFCTPCYTPIPKITGVIPAFIIDSTDSGITIPINQEGCYQVALSSDAEVKTNWLRMAQPYANDQSGFAVPLHAGNEVLLSFLYSNPDLPVIMGAVYNSTHKNIVSQTNKSQSGIISCNKSKILFDDTPGLNTITLVSADGTAKITIGT